MDSNRFEKEIEKLNKIEDGFFRPCTGFYDNLAVCKMWIPTRYFKYENVTDEDRITKSYNHTELTTKSFLSNSDDPEKYIYLSNNFSNYGLIDKDGNIILNFEYSAMHMICVNKKVRFVLLRRVGESKWSIYDLDNKSFVYNNEFDSIATDKSDPENVYVSPTKIAIPVSKNGLWGFINEDGKLIVDIKYQDAIISHNDYLIVKYNNKYRILDRNNTIITDDLDYDGLLYDDGNDKQFIAYSPYGDAGLIDINNKFIVDFDRHFDYIYNSRDNILPIRKNNKIGLINLNNGVETEAVYNSAHIINSDYVVVLQNNTAFLFNKNFNIISKVENVYNIGSFSDNPNFVLLFDSNENILIYNVSNKSLKKLINQQFDFATITRRNTFLTHSHDGTTCEWNYNGELLKTFPNDSSIMIGNCDNYFMGIEKSGYLKGNYIQQIEWSIYDNNSDNNIML